MDIRKTTKRYTAIKLSTEKVNDNVNVKLMYGTIDGPHYSQEHPKEEFDSEQDAIEYAYKTDKYSKWLILPVVRFNILDDNED